jgi:hypothetical protein
MKPNRSLSPAPEPGAPAGDPPVVVFSEELRQLIAEFEDRPVTLAMLLEATQGRGFHLLLVLIALPFVGPIPLPGFSIPFGLVVTLLGARLAVGQKPWLPERLLQKSLPPRFLSKWLGAAAKIMKWIEFFLRPRLGFVEHYAVFARLAGLLIALSGLMLMLPFPLPFSNSLPAWTVLLLASGALGRDGAFFFAGCTAFALSLVFFTMVALGGAGLFDWVTKLF